VERAAGTDGPGAVPASLPFAFARRFGVALSGEVRDGRRTVLVREPVAPVALAEARRVAGMPLRPRILDAEAFDTELGNLYARDGSEARQMVEDMGDELDLASLAESVPETEDLLEQADDAPIIRLINAVLAEGIRENASDVHIETFERDLVIRFRVDGVLREAVRPKRALAPLLVSRIKVMARLDIAEKRLPQDGRIKLKIAGRGYDVRLSTVPVAYGERLVMRLLPDSQELVDLEKLGMNEQQLQSLDRIIFRPNGIFLVTGPTGSGKTTTLHACLAKVNGPEKNIITVEDPVEITQPGIGQIEVNPKIKLTFAAGLRAILRQDPNVVLVGEIRDKETADIAIQASLTGHLVMSTLHTNDAASAITRLVDMGVEPFLVGSSLVAVLAQRLVRVLCPSCKTGYEASDEELREIGIRPPDRPVTVYRGEGCSQCGFTGYRGRVGIYEMMVVDDDIRGLITRNVDAKTIKKSAIGKGMGTLRADGARKVLSGVTSVAEVLRATEEEGAAAQI
jgi:general secretion pathway protein E